MKQGDKTSAVVFMLGGCVPVVWLGLLVAPYLEGNFLNLIVKSSEIFQNPFQIQLCEDSIKYTVLFLLAYAMGIGIYCSTKKNYRRGEEHGSAVWGSADAVNKKYRQKPEANNKLLTQHVRIGINGKKHRRNLNVLVCGGSGAGKTRFYCKPNIMQANTSFVVLDPKGEILRDTGDVV